MRRRLALVLLAGLAGCGWNIDGQSPSERVDQPAPLRSRTDCAAMYEQLDLSTAAEYGSRRNFLDFCQENL